MTGRLAPTPSGRMHIGNAVAMLAAWLSARSAQQPLLLRIEDIDTPRVVKDADRWIMDDLAWLGLHWDGEPTYQSERLDLYHEIADRLRADNSLVYPCFCSRAEIRAASAPQEGDGFTVYPGTCRPAINNAEARALADARVANGDRHSWRIAMPDMSAADNERFITFDDRIFGPQSFDLPREVGDSIIERSDGVMSYQLVVTADDLLMGVDDIVRGRDLLRSTALQIYIRERMIDCGYSEPDAASAHPQYAHIALIDNAAGKRLAKRYHSLDIATLRDAGASPEQVIGYAAWLFGIRDADEHNNEPFAMSADEALARFSWQQLRADLEDRRLPDDVEGQILTLR